MGLRYISCCLLLIGSLLVGGCGKVYSEQRPEAIASVGSERIEAEAFREGYVDYLLKTGLQDSPQYRTHFLNTLIAARLLVQEARAQGIEQEQHYQEALVRMREKLLVDIYVEKALFDTLQFAEDELKDMFVRSQTTLTARHLYASTLDQAEALHNRLMQGESFEALAREVFADTALANNGGFVGSFSVDDMDPAFESAAYALEVGEISDPVKTRQGYSIIQLEDRFTKPLITDYEYAERRDRIMHFVTFRKKTEARRDHVYQIIEEMEPQYEPEAFHRLLAQVSGRTEILEAEDTSTWLESPLVTFKSDGAVTTWRVIDFREAASVTSEAQRARVRSASDLEDFINGLIARSMMAKRANQMGLGKTAAYARAEEEAIRDWVWNEATERVLAQVAVPEDSIRSYYARYGHEFTTPEQVQVSEILVNSKADADAAKAALKTEFFTTVASRYSIRPGASAAGGNLGFLSREELGVLAESIWPAKAGAILGPLEVRGHYLLLQVGDRKPARPQAYNEARAEIRNRLQQKYRKEHLQNHVQTLRARQSVWVNSALLTNMKLKTEKA